MDSVMFCVLCGGPFDLEDHIYKIGPQNPAYQWLYDVRVLGTSSALENSRLAGVLEIPENHSKDDSVFLSEITSWSEPDTVPLYLGRTMYEALTDDEDGHLLFPLHSACIDIGCRMIQSHEDRRPVANFSSPLARLYHMLRQQFLHRKHFGGLIGNDILGLHTDYADYGPRSALAVDVLGWWGNSHEKFLTNPLDVGSLRWLFSVVRDTPTPRDSPPSISEPVRESAALEKLPTEILDQILGYLHPWSVISLHYASRMLLHRIPLDEVFWSTHMKDGTLLPHIWELKDIDFKTYENYNKAYDGTFQIHWQSVCKAFYNKDIPLCNRDHRFDDVPPGYWNRCRIWNIIRELCIASTDL